MLSSRIKHLQAVLKRPVDQEHLILFILFILFFFSASVTMSRTQSDVSSFDTWTQSSSKGRTARAFGNLRTQMQFS